METPFLIMFKDYILIEHLFFQDLKIIYIRFYIKLLDHKQPKHLFLIVT